MTYDVDIGMIIGDAIACRGMTQGEFAQALGTTRYSVNELVNNKRAVSPEMALRLAAVIGHDAEYWLTLQMHVGLKLARERLGPVLDTLQRLPRVP